MKSGPRYRLCVFIDPQLIFRYESLFERFLGIFKFKHKIPVYHIPGNHDIGYVSRSHDR